MRVEALAIALRSRQGWEAIDLGFRMATHWARPLWSVWLTVYVPVAVALLLALWAEPLIAALALWWIKPVLDRFALFVLSRRVFGDPAALAETLSAWRTVLSPGLLRAVVLRPLGWDRSFLQPIPLLERQRGPAARRRAGLLGRRLGGHAMALALACLCFELVVIFTLMVLGELVTPAAEVGGVTASSGLAEALGIEWWGIGLTLAYAVAIALVEPFYVAAGFAMYLVRRTQLEGWDIELALRRAAVGAEPVAVSNPPALPERPFTANSPLALAAIVMFVGFSFVPLPLHAETSMPVDASGVPVSKRALRVALEQGESVAENIKPLDTPARRAALEVARHSDFGQHTEVMRWRLDTGKQRKQRTELDFDWLTTLGEWIASAVRVMAWLLLAVLAMAVVWLMARRFGGMESAPSNNLPPTQMFGLAISPDSLPDDVVAAAQAALDAGRLREAVSLLYRGALSFLVHQNGMRIGEGATEGDVLRIATPLLAPDAVAHFRALIGAWVDIAYGHRPLEVEVVRSLCNAQRRHFAGSSSVAYMESTSSAVPA